MSAVLPVEAVFPKRLPWRAIFDDMSAAGYSYSRQAAILGAPWSTFHGWMQDGGSEPRYSLGRAILAMHQAVCGPALSEKRQREGVLQG